MAAVQNLYTNYKSHSFRIGATDSQICGLGRWKSDSFEEYLRSLPPCDTIRTIMSNGTAVL